MSDEREMDELRSRIGTGLVSAIRQATKELAEAERLLTEIAEDRFIDASMRLRRRPELLSRAAGTCKDLAISIDALDWLPPALASVSTGFLTTYRGDLESGLDGAGVLRRGEWPTYVCNDVLRLSVDLATGQTTLDGKVLDSSEVAGIVQTVTARSTELLGRPFDTEGFVTDLKTAYEGVCWEERSPLGEAVSIRKLLEKLQAAGTGGQARYSEKAFAVNLYRLISSPEFRSSYADKIRFEEARGPKAGIYVPGAGGEGRYLGGICICPPGSDQEVD